MLWGFSFSFILIFAFLVQNWRRSQVSEVKELIPNCLLTRAPLVFIPGKRSLFYFLAYWNEIPHWLASHGYEVFLMPLPWSNDKKRMQAFRKFLAMKSQNKEFFHLFLDQSSLAMVKTLLSQESFDCLVSVTLVGTSLSTDKNPFARPSIPIEEMEMPGTNSKTPLFWLLHLFWTSQVQSLAHLGWKMTGSQGQALLERAQFLAERDLLQNQRSPNL